MGDKAIASLVVAINSRIFSSASIPVVLRSLNELSESCHQGDIVRLLLNNGGSNSEHEDTRREALAGLYRLSPASGFALFGEALADSDLRIRKIAVRETSEVFKTSEVSIRHFCKNAK